MNGLNSNRHIVVTEHAGCRALRKKWRPLSSQESPDYENFGSESGSLIKRPQPACPDWNQITHHPALAGRPLAEIRRLPTKNSGLGMCLGTSGFDRRRKSWVSRGNLLNCKSIAPEKHKLMRSTKNIPRQFLSGAS
jgi:hypothetical protein